jgi:hypothetical protein
MQEESKFEDEYIKHVCFQKPCITMIDGKTNTGIVFKPKT